MKDTASSLKKKMASSETEGLPTGLRILIQHSVIDSNILVKPTFRLMIRPATTTTTTTTNTTTFQESSFLKSCYLCNKHLSLEMDVYMYRGDQGFCSINCRCRQIFIDEMKEMEVSTREMLASSRHCRPSRQVKSYRPRATRPAII